MKHFLTLSVITSAMLFVALPEVQLAKEGQTVYTWLFENDKPDKLESSSVNFPESSRSLQKRQEISPS